MVLARVLTTGIAVTLALAVGGGCVVMESKYKRDVADQTKAAKTARDESAAYKTKLLQMEKDKESLSKQVSDLQTKNSDLTSDLVKAKSEAEKAASKAKADMAIADTARKAADAKVATIQKQLDAASKELTGLRAQVADLNKALATAKAAATGAAVLPPVVVTTTLAPLPVPAPAATATTMAPVKTPTPPAKK